MSAFSLPVYHIMTSPVITTERDAFVIDAVKKMIDNDIECLVIIDADRKVVGILTFRDLVEKVLLQALSPEHVKVGEVMTKKVKTCRSSMSVGTVVKMMKKHRLRRIPVVDEDDGLVGIVTNFDIACLGLTIPF